MFIFLKINVKLLCYFVAKFLEENYRVIAYDFCCDFDQNSDCKFALKLNYRWRAKGRMCHICVVLAILAILNCGTGSRLAQRINESRSPGKLIRLPVWNSVWCLSVLGSFMFNITITNSIIPSTTPIMLNVFTDSSSPSILFESNHNYQTHSEYPLTRLSCRIYVLSYVTI